MDRKQLFSRVCGIIPKRINADHVLNIYELLQKTEKLFCSSSLSSVQKNTEAFLPLMREAEKTNGYIENQHDFHSMSYGTCTVRQSGCGVIAVYNALHTLNAADHTSLPLIIRDFEQDGITFSGHWGTSPRSILRYLTGKGYEAELTTDRSRFDTFSRGYSALILTLYNNGEDIRDAIHLIHISADSSGYTAHNAAGNGRPLGPCPSVSALIRQLNGGKAKGICLIRIRRFQSAQRK